MSVTPIFSTIIRLGQFHEQPQLIDWWQRRLGRFLDWFTPAKRRWILFIGSLWVVYKSAKETLHDGKKVLDFQTNNIDLLIMCGTLLCIGWLVFWLFKRFAHWPAPLKKHPFLTLHAAYWLILIALWQFNPAHYLAFCFALFMPYLIWRFSYMLQSAQQGRLNATSFKDQMIPLFPAYGGSETPYGKGLDFLSKFEAKDSLALAKSQLAGIKLFILAGVWSLVSKGLFAFLYGPGTELTAEFGGNTLAIPLLQELVQAPNAAGVSTSWLSIYFELFNQVLRHAIMGLNVVGFLRLFGFHVFRNTYKPLLAESIVEFWNRYYYYFKELLANFFFMPTFMQLGKSLKNWPKFRLFLAVFAAAFVGNMYYHIIEKAVPIAQGDVLEIAYNLRSRFFYCFLLALGIYFSMLREQGRAGKVSQNSNFSRYARIFGVWTFFSLIYIWNVRGDAGFMERTRFFFSLFGF